MTYATQADIDERYPGALTQAGPRDDDGDLDQGAIDAALAAADALIDERLGQRWPLPWDPPYSSWLVDIAVDLALYRATPAVVLADFSDRKTRYAAALIRLDGYASGELSPPDPPGASSDQAASGVFFSSQPRRFERGSLR